MLTVDFDWI